uniref:NAD-dependent epimerase/dehydratase domain-containing protein n=1 Tax=viral metagenome TaxID=1070528 RepID=A0A6C0LSY9_9ZZZZ
MNILITGAAGFVGSNILNELNDGLNKITVFDNLKTGYINNIAKNVNFINIDCSDEKILDMDLFFDCIIHVAGQASKEGSFEDVIYDLNANTKSTLILLEYAKKINCKRFIFISTVCVYGGTSNPGIYNEDSEIKYDTFYSIHKYTSEKYLDLYKKHYNIDFTIFRLFTCYGPGQDLTNMSKGMVSIYLSQFLNKNPNVVIKGSLDRYRDFIFVNDVAFIVKDSIKNKLLFNDIFNLGSGVKTTINELLNVMIRHGNFNKNIIVEDEIIGDMIGCVANNKKLRDIYKDSFTFTTLDEGIRKMINFYTNSNK